MLTRAASKGEEHGQEPKAGIVHGMILARYESGSPNVRRLDSEPFFFEERIGHCVQTIVWIARVAISG